MLFADERRHSLAIPSTDKDGRPSTIAFLIAYLCDNLMKDSRQELFVLGGHLYVSPPSPLHFPSPHAPTLVTLLQHPPTTHRAL